MSEATTLGGMLKSVIDGPAWHGPLPDGQSRINATNDWVRVEIETALQLDIPLLPVLVEEAEMPDPETLPSSSRAPANPGVSRGYRAATAACANISRSFPQSPSVSKMRRI